MIESKIWCNKCGYKKISQRHHIVPQSYFKQNHLPIDNTKKNTSDLCDLCHFLTPFLDGYEEIDKWKEFIKRPGYELFYLLLGAQISLKAKEITENEIKKLLNLMANHYVIISRMKELEKYSDVENFEYQDENRTKIVKKAVEYVINKGRNNCS